MDRLGRVDVLLGEVNLLKNNSVSLGRLSRYSGWFASHVCYFVYQISVIFYFQPASLLQYRQETQHGQHGTQVGVVLRQIHSEMI